MNDSKNVLPTFLVDTRYDHRERRRAIRGLRAVQKMGKLAEHALAEIASKGHFDQRAPWLSPAIHGKKYHVKYSRFPALPTISRETVPEYGPVRICPGTTLWKAKYGGFEYDCFDVRVRVAKPSPDGVFSVQDVKVGFVKMNVSNSAFNAVHHDENHRSRSVTLFREPRIADVKVVSKAIAEASAGPGFRTSPFPAVYYGRLCEWLVEDGHMVSFLLELRQRSDELRLAKHIISG